MAERTNARSSRSTRSLEQALALHQAGRLDEADRLYAAVLAAEPAHFDALHLSGMVKHQQGRLAEALRLVAAALKARPGSPEALMNYGVILITLERYDEALASFDRAMALGGGDARLHYNRGNALKHLKRHAEAITSYDRAIALEPALGVAHHNRGSALAALNRNAEALASYDHLLTLPLAAADRFGALNDRGKLLLRLKRHDEALANYDQLLALAPGDPEALTRRGAVLADLGRYDEALAHYAEALAAAPDFVDAHLNRGNALAAQLRMPEALASFAAVTAREPEHADAHFNEALVRLALGDFRGGWPKYEYRWRREPYAADRPNYPRPVWQGEADLAGKTILLCAEQGLGDAIQFVRYAPLVAALGAKVVVGAHRPLTALLASVPGVARVVTDGDALPEFDLYCSLLSLPLAFGTDFATIPSTVPYIRASEEHIARWRGRVPDSGRLRVGVCWAGTSAHGNDRNRSIPLERFATLFSVPGIDFVSLQKQLGEGQGALLRRHGVVDLGRDFADFADTAAVMTMLDLVISVDTSVAHLAGAMAKAVGLLLPFAPDWRWMLDRTDSPWYPTMRLIRQSAIGDWDGPLHRLRAELATLAQRRMAPR